MLAKSRPFDPDHLQHVSPLGWEHINLTGDYTWYTANGSPKEASALFESLQPLLKLLAYVKFRLELSLHHRLRLLAFPTRTTP